MSPLFDQSVGFGFTSTKSQRGCLLMADGNESAGYSLKVSLCAF